MRKNRERERYCSEVEKSKECYFFWMCSGLWSFTQTYKCKILTKVIFVAPLGLWFFPYLGGFSRKILVLLFLFYSRWLTALLCSAFIAFITANIISVTDLFPTSFRLAINIFHFFLNIILERFCLNKVLKLSRNCFFFFKN